MSSKANSDLQSAKKLMRLANLNPHPQNPNRHQPQEVALIRQSLRKFGAYKPLVVWYSQEDKRWYTLTGHCVAEAAAQEGMEQVWVEDRSDLTPTEAMALMAGDNEIARHLSYPDQDDLSQLIASIHAEDAKLAELAASGQEELQRLLKLAGQEPKAEDAEIGLDKAAELQEKWNVRLGDLFLIPSLSVPGKEHRIVCGDCTDASVAKRVLQEERVELVLEDPPYGINKAEWDDAEGWAGRIIDWAKDIVAYMVEDAVFYCFGWPERIAPLLPLFPFANKRLLVWHYENKNTPALHSWGRSYELIVYGTVGKPPFHKDAARQEYAESSKERAKYGLRVGWAGKSGKPYELHPLGAQPRDVLEFPAVNAGTAEREGMGHPTQKPLALICALVGVSTNKGDIVFDPFLGSGTTICACEHTGRLGRGCEIEPKYVSMSLERLQGLGLSPSLVQSS